ncbi:MAG: TonB-dependent receptor, partial [Gemmatimonadota bacterium]
ARHDVIAGMGYRIIHDDIEGAFPVEFSPVSRTISLVTAFLQDDIVILPGHLALTVGSKFEHNHFSGLEIQPNLRVLWTPTFSSTVWGAVSRAVRSPSRVDEDVISRFVFDNAGTTTIIQGRGTHHFKSEELVAYEMGYRATPHQRLSIDLAAFYNNYDRLRTLRASTPETQGSNVIIPFLVENEAKGQTYGGDAAITFQVSAWWRLRFGYSYLRMEVQKRKNAPLGTNIDAVPGFNPEHQGSIWSSFDLPGQIELDVAARYVSPLPGGTQDVPHYITGDAKLGFHLGSHVRFSVVGRDLFQARHFEFRLPALIVPEERDIERRVTAALAWAF